MGFFNKKVCDICGGEIGLLGNRKLADGNLCKNCARKLSPWMTDRRESTVEEIRQHLMYRAQNQRVLAGVRPDAAAGASTKVYIDRSAGKFFVTNQANWRDANPDVIDFSQVIDVQTEVDEHRTEEYHRDREGNQVSFDPPPWLELQEPSRSSIRGPQAKLLTAPFTSATFATKFSIRSSL